MYYADQRFAEVFTSLVRAPEPVAERIAALPGVDRIETRVVAPVNIEIEGYGEPVTGRIVSLPDHGEAVLNAPWLRLGRLPAPFADEEVTVSEDFARAHRLEPGDRIGVVIKGKRRPLTVVGVSLSPEYMYAIPPGAMFPDYERYGILWMNRRALATAYEMEGAFNDLSVTLQRGTSPRDVIDALDGLLARYGGLGAYDREDQFSHRFITEELRQLATMATVFPVIFLGVAALLLNVVVTRLVTLEREQIGTLKAFGYDTKTILAHYLKLVLAMVSIGLAAGVGAGLWLARGMTAIYQNFYSFPYLRLRLDADVFVQAVAVTLLAALAGTLLAVRRAAALPPAIAMRPEPPPVYRATFLERAGLQRRLAEPTRMILRDIARRPLRSALTVLGIAAAVGTLMITNFSRDAVGWMVDVQNGLSSREDMTVLFTEPTPQRALY
jgi:putative ABC transport system permease protein